MQIIILYRNRIILTFFYNVFYKKPTCRTSQKLRNSYYFLFLQFIDENMLAKEFLCEYDDLIANSLQTLKLFD